MKCFLIAAVAAAQLYLRVLRYSGTLIVDEMQKGACELSGLDRVVGVLHFGPFGVALDARVGIDIDAAARRGDLGDVGQKLIGDGERESDYGIVVEFFIGLAQPRDDGRGEILCGKAFELFGVLADARNI